MNTFTFRVATVSVGGGGVWGWGALRFLCEVVAADATSIWGASNAFPFSRTPFSAQFNSKCSQRGQKKPLWGGPKNSHTASLKPVFSAGGNTPICIVTAVVLGQLVIRESLQQHLQQQAENKRKYSTILHLGEISSHMGIWTVNTAVAVASIDYTNL